MQAVDGRRYFIPTKRIAGAMQVTISATSLTRILSEDEKIPTFWLGYFRDSLRASFHAQLLERYRLLQREGLSKATIARKLGKRPEQLTRWLSAPGNLEVDTLSDLALAMGCAIDVQLEKIEAKPKRNDVHIIVFDDLQMANDDAGYFHPNIRNVRPANDDRVMRNTVDWRY